MKKISNEVKVGVTALVTILVFIWLYSFLKGKDLLSNTNHYYAVYNHINGLAESSPVEINGYKVGVVQSINFIKDGTGRLSVKISVAKGFSLPVNTVAEVTTATLLAGMKIALIYGSGPGNYHNGDTIPGIVTESLVNKLGFELAPVKDKLVALVSQLDTTISGLNSILTPEFSRNINRTVSNLNHITGNMDEVINSKSSDLKTSLSNLSRFSKVLSDNSENFNNTIKNLKNISDSLATADFYSAVSNLKTTLERTAQLMDGLNKGKGTAGQLFTNDSLYINLNNTAASLDLLLKDMKENPKRYVHFSLFGKKNK
jgi:phospholipid/cholesterol/gamma-HCH transport system substrate-binding protein